MNLFLGLTVGLKEIWAHKFRSFLTMLGIILGVASLLSMFSLTAGMAKGMRETLQLVGGIEQINITTKDISQHLLALKDISPGRTLADVEAIRAGAPLISHLAPESRQGGVTLTYGNRSMRVPVIGTTEDYQVVNSHEMEEGRFLSALDQERAHRVCVIGQNVVDELWPDAEESAVGKVISLNGRPFTVVGVFIYYEREEDRRRRESVAEQSRKERRAARGMAAKRDRWGMFRRKNETVVIPINTMFFEFKSAQVSGTEDQGPNYQLDNLTVRVADVNYFEQALAQLTNILNITHRGIDDFAFDTREDWFDRIESSVRAAQLSGGLIAGISLLVGGIGITNIMLASITERVREIGVRRAVGARKRDIFSQILVESIVIGIIGGLIGLLFSGVMIRVLVLLAPDENSPLVEPWAVLISFSFAVVVGIVSGLYPAWKASSLDPIQALRYE